MVKQELTNKAHKIFVDPDEEIVFTVEKLMDVSANRIIMVVPHNAALVSSAVSLKILTRQMLKTDKLVVLVTDNKFGQKLAEKAGMVVTGKISEVDKNIWLKAKELKERLSSERDRLKSELIGARTESGVIAKDIMAEPIKAEIEEEKVPEVVQEEIKAIPEKKRLDDKIVKIGDLTIVAGGDIYNHSELLTEERIGPEIKSEDNNPVIIPPVVSQPVQAMEDIQHEAIEQNISPNNKSRTNLLGRDLSAVGAKAQPSRRLKQVGNNDKFKQIIEGIKEKMQPLLKSGGKRKYIQIGAIALLVFFVISYLFFPFVSITLVFAENEVTVNETIKANTDLQEVDLATLTIPANLISKTSSTSGDAVATGKGAKGNVAGGIIDIIFNKTSSPITLKSGTVITNIATNLKYVIQQDVVVPAAVGATPGQAEDVSVKAEKFGENYNVVGVESQYTIAGKTTNEMVGRCFRDITGGTTEETVVVSKEDLEALQTSLEDQLKQTLIDNLKSLISEEDILLTGSEKFKVEEVKPSVKEGKEATNFNMEVKMTVSALSVLRSDLKQISEEIVKKKEGEGNSTAGKINVDNPVIRNIKIDGTVSTFELVSKADVTSDVDTEQLVKNLSGKSVSEAREYLRSIEGIEEFRLKYTPSYIPFFLQKIPTDPSKVEVTKDSK